MHVVDQQPHPVRQRCQVRQQPLHQRPPVQAWRGAEPGGADTAVTWTGPPSHSNSHSSDGKSLEQVAEARAVYACCLVRRQCLAFALRTRQAHGIWGGLTAQERDQRYPNRTAAAPAANG